MAFEYKRYEDGESSYRLPKWRKDLEALKADIGNLSYDEILNQEKRFNENEIGLKHPTNGSFVRIKDDGTIELFTGFGTGIRLSTDETIQLFGNHIQSIGRETQFVNRLNHSSINGQSLAGGYPSLKEKGLPESFLKEANEMNRNVYGMEDNNGL